MTDGALRGVDRDRVLVLAALAILATLAWAYLARMADSDAMADAAVPQMQAWAWNDIVAVFVMWAVMMVAMMVPSATPMILVFAALDRRRRAERSPFVPTSIFVAGYVVAWTAFSVLATCAQWGLHASLALFSVTTAAGPGLAGGLLVGAGLVQWTPLTSRCLTECRSPIGFLTAEWRDGSRGALVMGVRHGTYCTGCCWALMAVLLVVGVMNLLWAVVIAVFVLALKVAPRGELVGRIGGGVLVVAGLAVSGQAWR